MISWLTITADSGVMIRDSYSVADEILDVWRTDEDKVVRSWEERFNLEQGYLRIPREYTEIKPDTDEEAAAEAKSEPEPE